MTPDDDLIPDLIKKREALLDSIDWARWDREQSKRLDLLDYLLGT